MKDINSPVEFLLILPLHMPRNKYQLEKFNKEYEQLNEHQKKAVDTIEGPVMVIAGPGTGKTQILSARIGKIFCLYKVEQESGIQKIMGAAAAACNH